MHSNGTAIMIFRDSSCYQANCMQIKIEIKKMRGGQHTYRELWPTAPFQFRMFSGGHLRSRQFHFIRSDSALSSPVTPLHCTSLTSLDPQRPPPTPPLHHVVLPCLQNRYTGCPFSRIISVSYAPHHSASVTADQVTLLK